MALPKWAQCLNLLEEFRKLKSKAILTWPMFFWLTRCCSWLKRHVASEQYLYCGVICMDRDWGKLLAKRVPCLTVSFDLGNPFLQGSRNWIGNIWVIGMSILFFLGLLPTSLFSIASFTCVFMVCLSCSYFFCFRLVRMLICRSLALDTMWPSWQFEIFWNVIDCSLCIS